MGERAELENDPVSLRNDDVAVDRAASWLQTRPPVGEHHEEVRHTDVAIVVELRWLGRQTGPAVETAGVSGGDVDSSVCNCMKTICR